jgi:hypothetical protein
MILKESSRLGGIDGPDVVFIRRPEWELTAARAGYVQSMAAICDSDARELVR